MLTFNQALLAYGVDPTVVRLLRHQTHGKDGRTPYMLWRDQRELFDAYQAVQQIGDRARVDTGFWASFVAAPDGRTLLAGVYAVQGREQVPADWPYPLSPRPADGQDELYRLDRMFQYAELEGRLYVDWGPATRAWVQRADRQDKEILDWPVGLPNRLSRGSAPSSSPYRASPDCRQPGTPPWLLGAAFIC